MLFGTGDNFVASSASSPDKLHFSAPFYQHEQRNHHEQDMLAMVVHRPGRRIAALSVCGTYAASLWIGRSHPAGVEHSITIHEVDIANGQFHELWSAPLPQQLYVPDAAFLAAAGPDDNLPGDAVVISLERGGNGAVAVGWASTDVVVVIEPPMANEPGGKIVICKKRVEHAPSFVALSTDFVFSISGPAGRLQCWHRATGELYRDGGTLSALQRVTALTYEASEALLIVGFANGAVRLISVESKSSMVALATIEVSSRLFSSSSASSGVVVAVSFAQRSTGEVLVVTEEGIALLNLRTQQLATARFSFSENGVGSPIYTAAVSTGNDFVVVSDGTSRQQQQQQQQPFVTIPCGAMLDERQRQQMQLVQEQQQKQQQRQQQQQSPKQLRWEQRVQVRGDAVSLAQHDNMSEISSMTGGAVGGVASPGHFSLAQHSNVSYNDRKHDDEGDDDYDDGDFNHHEEEEQEDDDEYLNEAGLGDVSSVVAGGNDATIAESVLQEPAMDRLFASGGGRGGGRGGASAGTWQRPPQPKAAIAGGKAAPAAKATAGKTKMPLGARAQPAGKKSVAPPAASKAAATAAAAAPAVNYDHEDDVHLLDGNPVCLLPTPAARAQQLPAVLRQAFVVAQQPRDPGAKPVTFNRGGPVKSSGYTNNVPWSVQQAEKAKKKKAVAAKRAAGKLPPQPVAVANYNTAVGATAVEHERATQLFDKQPAHRAAITAACFDLVGSTFFTGANDGTCHLLKLPLSKFEGQGVGLNSSLATGAVVSGGGTATSPTTTAASAAASTSTSSSSSTAVAPTAAVPVLSLDVGVSAFDPWAGASGLSAPSWNLFVSSTVGGAVTMWCPSPQSGAAPRIRHVFARDARAVRLCLRDSLLLAANGAAISMCRFAVDSGLDNRDELHRNRNVSRFAVVQEYKCPSAQAVLSMDTFNSLDSAAVVFGTSSKQVGLLDLTRAGGCGGDGGSNNNNNNNEGGLVWAAEEAHQRPVHAVALQRCSAFSALDPYSSPDAQQSLCVFASAACDNSVRLWDIRRKGTPIRVLNKHTNSAMPLGLCLSPCGKFVATGSEDRHVCIYDLAQGSIVAKMRVQDNATALRYHPLKAQLMAGLANGKMRTFVEGD